MRVRLKVIPIYQAAALDCKLRGRSLPLADAGRFQHWFHRQDIILIVPSHTNASITSKFDPMVLSHGSGQVYLPGSTCPELSDKIFAVSLKAFLEGRIRKNEEAGFITC